MSPLISCIVPVYDGEKYLKEALDSILFQTYKPLEIIVVDDGSTDNTCGVVETYGRRVRYLKQSNAGPAAARNLGLSAARGDFVAFMDADDLWHPEKLQRQMARFAARHELDLSLTYVQNFWIPELRSEAEHFRTHRFAGALPGYIPSSFLVRRLVFEIVGEFNTGLRVLEDADWLLRAAEQGIVMEVLPDAMTYRRLHHTNISRQHGSIREGVISMTKASLDRRRRAGAKLQELALPKTGEGGQS